MACFITWSVIDAEPLSHLATDGLCCAHFYRDFHLSHPQILAVVLKDDVSRQSQRIHGIYFMTYHNVMSICHYKTQAATVWGPNICYSRPLEPPSTPVTFARFKSDSDTVCPWGQKGYSLGKVGLRPCHAQGRARSSMGGSSSFDSLPQNADTAQIPCLVLNGFRLSMSGRNFRANTLQLPDNSQLKALRKEHPNWILYWREGLVYAIPRAPEPGTTVGTSTTLACDEHLTFLASIIDERLPQKFPAYEAFRRRPFAFISRRDEIIDAAAKSLRTP